MTIAEFGPVTLSHLNAYAEASGDFNPIHREEEAAKRAGLPGIIAHGMLSAAVIASGAEKLAGDPSWKWAGFQTRFKGMVFLGDTIFVTGSVKSSSDSSLVLDLVAKNQRGDVVTLGVAEFSR